MIRSINEDLLYQVTRVLVLNDSISEGWLYHKDYTLKSFKKDVELKKRKINKFYNKDRVVDCSHLDLAEYIIKLVLKYQYESSSSDSSICSNGDEISDNTSSSYSDCDSKNCSSSDSDSK